ncbi:MAG: tRNA (N(6)-L-threonylcarbamoyladenosine(37)-C(2))-methylthiotransferase MtaB [candidate division Zixibacteria bacterium]|nr:tRNA (N(6)-L-threonylcarbamoyladenosine(37)-C(2))-methylthiotransferase MtaB [candidate division Zixibacteria bacterium]MDH3935782.1 tRNA (N(6)-L-threonylcarbamoyladenosine(37)-C(2))-methylthiotransferase MtaB [candidate division Zixibacteria bacterium]MDH4032276.1 tRNA (N(6)-L-threonylcarbamoyladenosine(37)-C(2))-methylthiotransferase MtaB [candidate division Zixibacteria bacterium]
MKSKATKTIAFQTVGCRLNQYETEKMAAGLAPFGFERVAHGQPADLYIINTCTVTHRADKDSRYLVRRAKRENPDCRVVLVGCYVETDPAGIAALNGVDVVVGNREKDQLPQILPEKLPGLFDNGGEAAKAGVLTEFHQRNRAWIKISDGCNQVCTFCLVTIVRGELTCRPAEEIVAEINELVAGGYNEVVLTGVNIGYYNDNKVDPPIRNLSELCARILQNTELYRMRLSSIEPQTVTDDLVRLCSEQSKRICRHFHLPLQSGSSRLLKLMRRPYDRERFLEKAAQIRQAIPNVIIGADVIVGFPSETEEDFADSCSITESGLVDYLHVFSYSDRPGTPAAAMTPKVKPQAIKERSEILTQMSDGMLRKAYQRQVGQRLEAISEHRGSPGECFGISDNYVKVKLPDQLAGGRHIVKLDITESHGEFVSGELL